MSTKTVSAGTEAPDWLDGSTEIELSARHLRAYWDADLIDVDDRNPHDTIIERKDPFEVCFRVYLKGRLWRCICGHWCFDLGFPDPGPGGRSRIGADRLGTRRPAPRGRAGPRAGAGRPGPRVSGGPRSVRAR